MSTTPPQAAPATGPPIVPSTAVAGPQSSAVIPKVGAPVIYRHPGITDDNGDPVDLPVVGWVVATPGGPPLVPGMNVPDPGTVHLWVVYPPSTDDGHALWGPGYLLCVPVGSEPGQCEALG